MKNNNGNTPVLPPYVPVLVLAKVICQECNNAVAFPETQLVACRSTDELFRRAEKEHQTWVRGKGILCVKSKLIILYENAFISVDFVLEAGA